MKSEIWLWFLTGNWNLKSDTDCLQGIENWNLTLISYRQLKSDIDCLQGIEIWNLTLIAYMELKSEIWHWFLTGNWNLKSDTDFLQGIEIWNLTLIAYRELKSEIWHRLLIGNWKSEIWHWLITGNWNLKSDTGFLQEMESAIWHWLLTRTYKNLLCVVPILFQFSLTLYSIYTHFDTSTTESFWKHCWKGEIARNEKFLLFPQCFLLNQIIVSQFVHIFDMLSLFATEFEEPKIGISGKAKESICRRQIKMQQKCWFLAFG